MQSELSKKQAHQRKVDKAATYTRASVDKRISGDLAAQEVAMETRCMHVPQ